LGWLQNTRILAKGHTLMYLKPGVAPDWITGKPFDQARDLATDYARRMVRRFRHRVHTWDVINEEHLQNALGFTREQQIEITRAAAQAAREADPTCCRIVNNCCTWSEYMRQPKLGQQAVRDYLNALPGR
jgi:GH35 family endo-1,4-beta-xylanase